jgi:8-oxo-dGTP diphosphatase
VTARFCLACRARLTTVVEEGHRRRRCPRCGWTYYANPVPASVAVIIEAAACCSAAAPARPMRGPGTCREGFWRPMSLPLDGLRRELREEIGVGVRHATLIGFTVLTAVYRAHPTSRHMRAADDVSELRWFPLDKIPYRQIAFPSIRKILRHYLSH